jgi:ABC-type transporter Mla subunit MlaD
LAPSPLLKVDPISATTARKRAEIENVLDQDPTLLLRSDRARRLYQELLEQTARAEAKVDDDLDTARPELKPLVEKLRRARVLEASRDVVDDLHRELFGPER